MDPISRMIEFVKANDLKGLEAFCRDLMEVSAFCKGYALLDYGYCADEMFKAAITHDVSVEILVKIYLSGPSEHIAAIELHRALSLNKFAYAEALVAAGVRVSYKTRQSNLLEILNAEQETRLKAYIAWHDALAIVKNTSPLQWLTQSHLKLIETSLQVCANTSADIFGNYVNQITQNKESNPLTLWQWNCVKEAICKLHQNCEKIEAESFKNYKHPEDPKALSKTILSASDKKSIETKAAEIISPLWASIKNDAPQIQQELIWYFSTPETSVASSDVAEKIVRVRTVLDSKKCLFDFYLQNPDRLLPTPGNTPATETTAIAMCFREACVKIVNPEVKKSQVMPQKSGLPGFSEAHHVSHRRLMDVWRQQVFTYDYASQDTAIKMIKTVAEVLSAMEARPNLKDINLFPVNFSVENALLHVVQRQFIRVAPALLAILDKNANVERVLNHIVEKNVYQVAPLVFALPSSLQQPCYDRFLKLALVNLRVEVAKIIINKPGVTFNEETIQQEITTQTNEYWRGDAPFELQTIGVLFAQYRTRPKITSMSQLSEKLFSKEITGNIINTQSLNQFAITFPLYYPDTVLQLILLNQQIKNKWFFQTESDFKKVFILIAKQEPELLVEFARCIFEKKVENPFLLKEWELWIKLFSSVSEKLKDEIAKYRHPQNLPRFGEQLQLFQSSSDVIAPLTTVDEAKLAQAIKDDMNKAFANVKLTAEDYNALMVLCQPKSVISETEFNHRQDLLMKARALLQKHGSKLEGLLAHPQGIAANQVGLAKRHLQTCLQNELQLLQPQVESAAVIAPPANDPPVNLLFPSAPDHELVTSSNSASTSNSLQQTPSLVPGV